MQKYAVREQQEQQNESGFLFFSSTPALDLCNTKILVRGKERELLSSPEEAKRWWSEAVKQHLDRDIVHGEELTIWDNLLLQELHSLRSTLRQIFLALIAQRSVNPLDLERLNAVLASGYRALERGPEADLVPIYHTTFPERGAILLPLALSALRVITDGERERLHKCSNERCVAIFYDTTRSATRHWCSTECMNRARSLQNYRKAKTTKAASS